MTDKELDLLGRKKKHGVRKIGESIFYNYFLRLYSATDIHEIRSDSLRGRPRIQQPRLVHAKGGLNSQRSFDRRRSLHRLDEARRRQMGQIRRRHGKQLLFFLACPWPCLVAGLLFGPCQTLSFVINILGNIKFVSGYCGDRRRSPGAVWWRRLAHRVHLHFRNKEAADLHPRT